MRLLVVHDKPRGEVGGMNTLIAAQNALLARAGCEVAELICTVEPQPVSIHVRPSGRRVGWRAAGQLRSLLERLRPDAVILHSTYYAIGPSALRWLVRHVPTVYVLHDVTPLCPRGTRITRSGARCRELQGLRCIASGCYRVGEQAGIGSDGYGLLMRALQMRAARAVRSWVAPSAYLSDLLVQHGVRRDRVEVVHHFSELRPDREREPVPGRLLFAGRLVPEKGIEVLVAALGLLRTPHWSLHVAGDGPRRAGLANDLARAGLGSRVRFLGALSPDALAREYVQASVVVMPSLIPESFGLVGLESMAHGRPVVAFDSGGIAEWLRHGVTGLVAAWGDHASLAAAADALLARPEEAREMGLRGRRIALREFSPERHLERMLAILDRAIADHGLSSQGTDKSAHRGRPAQDHRIVR